MFPKRPATESALTLLSTVREEFRIDEAAAHRRQRIAAVVIGPVGAVEIRRHAAYFRIVSIAEAYVDVLQMSLLSEELSSPTALMLQILDTIERGATISWPSRQDAFLKYHQIDLRKCSNWNELLIATRVRNCLAHALGGITPRYRTKTRFPIDLASIGVGVGGGRVHLDDVSIEILEAKTRGFISSLDQKT
ncbi:MAG TPA: hypothetical protein VG318_04590 [Actinomycetota bacterium]|nr:hypothetical protein [Actinomycetota bacterium]